ncbi:Phospholipase C/P1 nuclease [Glarea lozoyensis ATCC 20868]|uniref:Phospholipase C/P1 nuclease n=1 Tax=Glarea lozoyensis (strain ATCC 20868 / MF5171) TaxID=1116229 RepID=S3DDN5_GLAL2|nr:Phospholipase C/P1 nuclease [Glarea lozoyensis ATCC 20868]EPE35214.1 Phospholipase C/P1 nuclease [Glarea lozoyensis ATCC 20868]
MKNLSSISLLILASAVQKAACWGALGHYTVGYIASNFVTNATQAKFQAILGDTSADYLASVAAYADSYRSTAAGTFTAPFHYIDALDNPPESCGVDFERDCTAAGCVVSAISNYTQRVQNRRLKAADVALAAKMIVHFLGDIHQPLHDENLELGGNGIKVKFDGVSTNLHSVWDTSIPQKFAGTASFVNAKTWATNLTETIKYGAYSKASASWLDGLKLSDPVASSMVWARDTNSYVCSAVLPDGRNATEAVDLGGEYYAEALPVVQLQIAKAGYRLAGWLNLITASNVGF